MAQVKKHKLTPEMEKHKWQKGQSGNPKGRPKKKDSLTTLLKDLVNETCPQDKQSRTYKELIVLASITMALKGHPAALQEIWNRHDGKVTQPLDLELKADRYLNGLAQILGSPVAGEEKFMKTEDLIAALEKRGFKIPEAAQPHDRR